LFFFAVRTYTPVEALLESREALPKSSCLPDLDVIQYSVGTSGGTKAGETLDSRAVLQNVPRKTLGKAVSITAHADGFFPLDTTVKLSKKTTLYLRRDPQYYGSICFTLWNPIEEKVAPGIEIAIEGVSVTADEKGKVTYSVPLECQKRVYRIESDSIQLLDTIVRPSAGDGYVVLFYNN
jgi:hypothetical protein